MNKYDKNVLPKKRFKQKSFGITETDFSMCFTLTDGYLDLNIDWNEAFDFDQMIELFVPIATGDIIAAVFAKLADLVEPDLLEMLRADLSDRLKALKVGEADEAPPIVQPIHGINHLINLYASKEEG